MNGPRREEEARELLSLGEYALETWALSAASHLSNEE